MIFHEAERSKFGGKYGKATISRLFGKKALNACSAGAGVHRLVIFCFMSQPGGFNEANILSWGAGTIAVPSILAKVSKSTRLHLPNMNLVLANDCKSRRRIMRPLPSIAQIVIGRYDLTTF